MRIQIRKPWVSRKRVSEIEFRILDIDETILSYLSDFSLNPEKCSISHLRNIRDSINRNLTCLNETYRQYSSCFLFSSYNPNYESANSHGEFLASKINIYIGRKVRKRS